MSRPDTEPPGGAGAFSAATGRSLEDGSGADQRRYRAFQLEMMRPYLGPTVLEIGAGLGEFAAQLGGLQRHVVTDVDPQAVASMAERFADRPEVEARVVDLSHGPVEAGDPVSTVVAINVLEHLDDDTGALRTLAQLIEPGGRIVLWVPAYMQLYGEFDRAVGHVRRYTPATMGAAIRHAGLTAELVRPVNFLGGIAWWATVRRGGVSVPRPGLVRAYDRFVVPVTRAVETRVTLPFGQSVLAVAAVS
jgi:SAM-dependent methyltransferase